MLSAGRGNSKGLIIIRVEKEFKVLAYVISRVGKELKVLTNVISRGGGDRVKSKSNGYQQKELEVLANVNSRVWKELKVNLAKVITRAWKR